MTLTKKIISSLLVSSALLTAGAPAYAASCGGIEFAAESPTDKKEFKITATDVSLSEGEDVWIKINCEDEKARLYKPEKTGDGAYSVYFDAADFDNKNGIYYASVYALDSSGAGAFRLLKKRGIEVVDEVPSTQIMGKSQTTPEQMARYFKESGYEYPSYYEEEPRGVSLEEFARMYYDICEKEGVRAEAAWSQMCNETKFLNFGNLVKIEQFNFAGLGALGPGEPGFNFAESYGDDACGIEAGITAHVQHLKCYASDEGVNILYEGKALDPRWNESLRNLSGTLERLEGKWAVSPGYGMDLSRGVAEILATPKKNENE